MNETKRAARIAGLIYLSMVFIGPFSLMYVPGKLVVRGNAAATAANVLGHETLFRMGMIADMAGAIIFICLAVAFYRLFENVDRRWCWLLFGFVAISSCVAFVDTLNSVAALTLFRGGEFLGAFDQAQREALGMLFVRLHGQGNLMNEMLWGLWLWPLGMLVIRSGFIPRFIGYWLLINAGGWIALNFTAMLCPAYYESLFRLMTPVLFGELALVVWLVIKGAKPAPLETGVIPVFV